MPQQQRLLCKMRQKTNDFYFMEERRIKQVIVVRKDLNMRKGKMVAQGAHAAVDTVLSMMQATEDAEKVSLSFDRHGILAHWLETGVAKICLYVNSEEELLAVYKNAQENNLPTSLIEDAGLTEFHGEVTKTCLAIGPWYGDEIDKVTGELKLL